MDDLLTRNDGTLSSGYLQQTTEKEIKPTVIKKRNAGQCHHHGPSRPDYSQTTQKRTETHGLKPLTSNHHAATHIPQRFTIRWTKRLFEEAQSRV